MNSDFVELLSLFNKYQVRYLLVGGYAVMYHSEPRFTKDIDFFIASTVEDIARLSNALEEFGIPLSDSKKEQLQIPNKMIVLGIPPNRIDLLNKLGTVEFETAWEKRILKESEDTSIWVIDIDSLIEAKRCSNRPQDRLDIEKLEKSKHNREKN